MIEVVSAPVPIELRSAHFDPTKRPKTQAIVIHATCGAEKPGSALACAKMFSDPALKPRRSAHEVWDSTKGYRCVPNTARAWHAGHTANVLTYAIEICGQASQSLAQWDDEFSRATLALVAGRVRVLAPFFNIPVEHITAEDLVAGRKGIVSHFDVGLAWHETDHVDPGPNFPWFEFLNAAKGIKNGS